MIKITIAGPQGSGKTTLARGLAEESEPGAEKMDHPGYVQRKGREYDAAIFVRLA